MRKYIKCPACGHRHMTRIGTILKAKTIYGLSYDSFGSLRYANENYPSTITGALKSEIFLGFYCSKCRKDFPKDQTASILDYIEKKRMVIKLKR